MGVKLRGENRLLVKTTPFMYKYYKEEVREPVDKLLFNKVVNDIMYEVHKYLLTGEDFYMPYRLGVLGFRWYKNTLRTVEKNGKKVIRGLPIDWGATYRWYKANIPELKDATMPEFRAYIKQQNTEDKVIIKNFNEHTQGKSLRLCYFKEYPGAVSKYKSKKYKQFKTNREFKIIAGKVIKENPDIPFPMHERNIR